MAATRGLDAQSAPSLPSAVWRGWFGEIEKMQALARRRGWELKPLRVELPATKAELERVEATHGVTVPPQLRHLLLYWSSGVAFGWTIPQLYRPLEKLRLPFARGFGKYIWSLDHIDKESINNFNGLHATIANLGDGEEPNAPQMWVNQFAFASLDNGDVLTIDVSAADGPQPVRYFSIDREGLHHHAIAPDFFSFITAYTRLGCPGSDQDDWFTFIPDPESEMSYLDPDGEGAHRWRDWLEHDLHKRDPDEPPVPVPAETKSDFDLLDAAQNGSAFGIHLALAAGAVPDCVDGNLANRSDRSVAFESALIFAVRRGDLGMVERLLAAGASIDTRLLSVSEAIRHSSVDVVRWLVAHGARANGWKGERYWPLHILLTQPAKDRQGGDATTLPMLDALLAAGADPDARWDNDKTMLMCTGPAAIKMLLEHGADPNLFDHDGYTALYFTMSAEAVRLLAAHGANVNVLSRPPKRPRGSAIAPHTPYQARLEASDIGTLHREIAEALLTAGADPLERDGLGRSSLWYCRTIADARRLLALGLDPHERGPDGATLLHGLVIWYSNRLARNASGVELFTFYQQLGVDINAGDRVGATVLHLAAQSGSKDDVGLLLKLGADKTLRDKKGRLPMDRAAPSNRELRDLLRV